MNALKTAVRLFVALIFVTAARAAALPTDTVVQNLNGVQQCIKTYTLSPDYPSEKLAEAAFERDGYSYTFSSMSKKENYFEDEKPRTETVTVKTSSRELSDVLSALPPTKEYDDGKYRGVLNLNASTIHTEAAGQETQSYAVSATREFQDLDSNDMSYIPPTATKDGVTLSLQSVDWQVQESELVEDMLIPSAYKATAYYAGTGYRKSVTGYVSTASYTGTVSCRPLKDVTYTVTYVGTPIEQPPVETEPPQETVEQLSESAEQPDAPEKAAETSAAPPDTETQQPTGADAETPPEAEKANDGDSPENAESVPAAETSEPTEVSEVPTPDKPDNKESEPAGNRYRLLYAGGGIVALIIILAAASAHSRRKQRASAYDYDDYPYYNDNGYGQPPYNGDGSPPYEPEGDEPYAGDANAPYDDGGPAPWETDAWNGEENPYPNADNGVVYSEDDGFPPFDIPGDAPPPESAEEAESAEEYPDNGRGDASGA